MTRSILVLLVVVFAPSLDSYSAVAKSVRGRTVTRAKFTKCGTRAPTHPIRLPPHRHW